MQDAASAEPVTELASEICETGLTPEFVVDKRWG